jgi:hypothetical protein
MVLHIRLILDREQQNSRILNCNFIGKSKGPAIYLSPEGGHHTIRNCVFDSDTGERREVLSVDGSENNLITENNFKKMYLGWDLCL